ncbi:cytochrome P450 [Colletotrichum phormii]|uniref:Cytochrome P450 n=1 Tax=Colletotrichum phormii TaxID=359342 RepID=A0AAI9ZF63_9PEZI|nr:cytochrome P450 [Colletotrichum phormii]KAK1623167.1 cytochrome P450 [Colletotrichum phormii]
MIRLDWVEINLREHVLQIIARMSSQVFLGNEGASNDAWLKITMEYTTNAYVAAMILRMFPESLRPYIHWVLPQCRNLRKQVAEARRIVADIVHRRNKEKAAIEAEGRSPRVFNDVTEWFAQDEKDGHSDYDPVVGQLILMQAAIHTTTDLLTQSMLDIALHLDMTQALRRDVEQAVHRYGWSKSTLAEMHLVDAAVKESQRLKPIARTSMHRLVLKDIELSDGTLICKDSILGISVDQMWNPNVYERPAVWNPHRFYHMSQAGEKAGSLTNTSPDYLAWGYGKHACAGRFFVAQEVKVALSHLLLHYEWKLVPSSGATQPLELGLTLAADPMARVMIRKLS